MGLRVPWLVRGVRYAVNRFRDGRALVDEAVRRVSVLVEAEAQATGGKNAAISALARRHGLSRTWLRALHQPSRRPKDIGVSVWRRLREAYARHLRRQLAELEAELARVEAVGGADPAVQAVVERARVVAAEAEAMLDEL